MARGIVRKPDIVYSDKDVRNSRFWHRHNLCHYTFEQEPDEIKVWCRKKILVCMAEKKRLGYEKGDGFSLMLSNDGFSRGYDRYVNIPEPLLKQAGLIEEASRTYLRR